jgi:biopolymer transport protein ExbD
VLMEGLGKVKEFDFIGKRTNDLSTCSIVPLKDIIFMLQLILMTVSEILQCNCELDARSERKLHNEERAGFRKLSGSRSQY